MDKLNIANFLKDCPSGIKLYTTVWGDVEFIKLCDVDMIKVLPISNPYNTNNTKLLYSDGRFTLDGECILFPSKNQRNWSKFHRPFKDGDIVRYLDSIAIFKEWGDETLFRTHVTAYLHGDSTIDIAIPLFGKSIMREACFATEEEKQKLFDSIKTNGYKWNAETKTLEKLIESKFKVGDKIKHKDSGVYCILREYSEGISAYRTNIGLSLTYKDLEQWELAPNKFDITTLKPFDKVLVRCSELEVWHINFFEKYNRELTIYPFICLNNNKYSQCIPYKDNEYLLGIADKCDNFYKTWK